MKRLTSTALALCLASAPAFAQTANQPDTGIANDPGKPAIDVKLPLDEAQRTVSTEVLQGILYDMTALQHNVHQAHWNIEGIEYIQLHEFYQELYETLFKFIDESAERKLQLSVPADSRPSAVAKSSRIPEIKAGFMGDVESLRILSNQYSILSANLYKGIDATDGDLVTQDLLISFSHMIDQHFWQLRAHLNVDRNATKADGTAMR